MKNLDERIANALKQDNAIVASRADIDTHPGRSYEEMEALGLAKQDLKWLERKGLAVRGYTANGGLAPDKSGKLVRRFGPGSRVKWILLAEEKTV